MMRGFRSFGQDRNGAVAVTAAVSIPILLGFVALVAEFGNGILVKSQTQRIADAAAYAAAVNYSTTNSTTAMNAVAQNIAVLNGLTAQSVTASLVQSPRNASDQAVLVNIATTLPMIVAPVLGFNNQLPVSSDTYVAISGTTSASGCVIALDSSGNGITLSGSATINAPSCSVASNNAISVPCGTFLTAKTVTYNAKKTPTNGCGGLTGTISKASTSDPFASDANVQTAGDRAHNALSLNDPSAPAQPKGSDLDFGWDSNATQNQLKAVGCSGSFANNTWTATCSNATVTIQNMTVAGGISVQFSVNGSASTTYNFDKITHSGSTMNFGPGTYNVSSGMYFGGGTNTTFAGGTFNVGANQNCSDGQRYSICHLGTSLTFTNASTFVFKSGIYVNGGASFRVGTSSTTNSYNIGSASSSKNALKIGGGATVVLGDATGKSSVFTLNGSISESGGSCVTLPAATYHDIDGNMDIMGGMTLGAGHYAISGYFAAGAAYGGDVSCNGTMVGISANNVSLAIGGSQVVNGGSCNKMSFCINAGFGTVTIKAPTSGTFANLAIIGPIYSGGGTGGVSISEGSNNTRISGLLYYPNGPLNISGSATIGNGSGDCLQIIASEITISGSGKASVGQCSAGSGSSSTKTVGFVQ